MTDDAPPQPMTAEDVVRRIASECAFVDPHGGVGIRLKPAAAIVRQYADQFRAEPRVARQPRRPAAPYGYGYSSYYGWPYTWSYPAPSYQKTPPSYADPYVYARPYSDGAGPAPN